MSCRIWPIKTSELHRPYFCSAALVSNKPTNICPHRICESPCVMVLYYLTQLNFQLPNPNAGTCADIITWITFWKEIEMHFPSIKQLEILEEKVTRQVLNLILQNDRPCKRTSSCGFKILMQRGCLYNFAWLSLETFPTPGRSLNTVLLWYISFSSKSF